MVTPQQYVTSHATPSAVSYLPILQFPKEELQNLETIRDHIQEKSLKKLPNLSDDDAVTLDQYVRNLGATENTCRLVNVWARVMHGVESTEQPASFFIDYCRRNKGLLAIRADDHTGGQYLRLPAGTNEHNIRTYLVVKLTIAKVHKLS